MTGQWCKGRHEKFYRSLSKWLVEKENLTNFVVNEERITMIYTDKLASIDNLHDWKDALYGASDTERKSEFYQITPI